MTVKIDINALTILKQDILPKTGGDQTLVLLTGNQMDQILALQDKVFNSLSEAEKPYLLKKEKEFFQKHLDHGNLILGVVHDGQLIAQSILLNPTKEHPKTGMVDMKLPSGVDKITIIQGVIVDPDYRGNKLMTTMVDTWLDISKKNKRKDAISEVTVENHYSWSVFLKEGMHIHSIGTDPSDGTVVYNMHAHVSGWIKERLHAKFNDAAAKITVSCKMTDIENQKKLLKKGYIGTQFDAANQNIVFEKKCQGPLKKILGIFKKH